MDEPSFESKLSAIVSKQLTGDYEAIGLAIERLTDALVLAIAVSSRGDSAAADTMVQGVDGYLIECVASHRKLAEFMSHFAQRKAHP